jgi:hypothetical protein
MAIPEILKKYFDEDDVRSLINRDFIEKIRPLDATDETELCNVGTINYLKTLGLSKWQIVGVQNILASASLIGRFDEEGNCIETYRVKVGDLRELNDEQLQKLTGQIGVRVLRVLFGAKEEPNSTSD